MLPKSSPAHIGQNIARIRELRGLKQDGLAYAIGLSQQTISLIENSELVDDEKLKIIAVELGVTVEIIKNFSEESLMSYFDTLDKHHSRDNFTFNPIDKLMEVYSQKESLYERLLHAEREKVAYLEKLLKAK